MNSNTASQFMDKQIMDLSNSQTPVISSNNNSSNSNEFIDFMNRNQEKKDDIVPSYDFMPIRPAVGSSSPPMQARAANFDSGDDDGIRRWNSFDSKENASSIRNYGSVDAEEPAKFVSGKNQSPSNAPLDASLISEIDRTMKKYMDNLTHAVDSMSARLSQLETRTRHLENSIDDLKLSVGENHGSTDGKMRHLENMVREVQTGVQVIKDKQEIIEAKLQIAKMQIPKTEKEVESKKTQPSEPTQTRAYQNQHFPPSSPPQQLPALTPPNAPPQLNLQPQPQLPNQLPQTQVPSVPQYQIPENTNQQYQIPPPQQQPPPPPPSQHQYQPPPPPAPPSQPHYSQPPPPPPSQPQPPLTHHHPEETPYIPNQTYQPNIRPPNPPTPSGVPPPPSQQYYSPAPNLYEPQSNRPGPGYPGSFGPPSGHGEPYPYSSSPSQYGGSPPMKPHQQVSSSSGYPQLPTARILPQAVPTASAVGSGSGSGSGNKVPIDDVVDRVTNMGFPREQVRATVRKLTENGQAVDLNVVLDKLMNDGDGQGQRGWFGR